jgi:orotate phosphoribosyltransferase
MILDQKLMNAREAAADCIFLSGSCLIDIEKGFRIAYHDEQPEAPRSPFYLNLRQTGVKGGTLEPADIDSISQAMLLLGIEEKLFHTGQTVCSIPAAGDPYLDSIMRVLPEYGIELRRFVLEKYEQKGKRAFRLHPDYVAAWKNALMIDDLVTSASTKRLAAGALTQMRGGVSDLLVFLNRSTTVGTELKAMGIRLHAVWEFEDLMEWALGKAYLTRKQYNAIIEYPTKLEEFKRSISK